MPGGHSRPLAQRRNGRRVLTSGGDGSTPIQAPPQPPGRLSCFGGRALGLESPPRSSNIRANLSKLTTYLLTCSLFTLVSLFERAIQVLLYPQPQSPCMRGTRCSSTRQPASSSVIKSRSGPAARCSNAKVMPWGSQRPQSKRSYHTGLPYHPFRDERPSGRRIRNMAPHHHGDGQGDVRVRGPQRVALQVPHVKVVLG